MASGTINGSTNNQYIKCKIEWTSTKNVSANTSSVTAKLYYWRTNTGYRTYGAEKYTLTINGVSKSVERSYSEGIELTNSTPVLAHTFTTTVSHNADGKKSITIKATGGKTSGSFTSTTCSGTATLDTIPRATTPSFSTGNLKLGNTLTINLPRASSSFTHKVTWKFGSQSGTISSSAGTSCTWTPNKSLASQIPNNASGSCTITVQTLNGSTSIGTKTAALTLTVSDDTVPTALMTVSEAVEPVQTQIGAYVKGQSKLQIALSGNGSYGSTIKSYKITANGKTYTSATATTDFLTTAGTNTITGTVTDSRGRTKSVTQTITVLDYAAPSVTSLSAVRCSEDGTADEEGGFAKVTFSWKISDCGGKNTKSASVTYKKRSDTSWQNAPAVTLSGYTGTTSLILSGINTENIYDVLVTVRDFFCSGNNGVSRGTYVPTAFTLVDYRAGGHGIAFGKVAEEDLFDVNLKSRFRKGVYLMDSANTEYAGVYDNGTNLWIGANQGDNGVHHTGGTYLSSGINTGTGTGNESIRVYIPDKNGDGNYYNVWHKGMTFKILWSGTWSSGTIEMPEVNQYNFFMMADNSKGTLIPVFKFGKWLRGIGGYLSPAGNTWTYSFNAEITDTATGTISFLNAGGLMVNDGTSKEAWTTNRIYGLL